MKCAPLSELLRTSKSSLKSANLQHCTFRNKIACVHYGSSMIVHALIVLLSRASPKHSPHPASCFPAQLLVCYLQLCNQALTWGKYGLSSEMRPKCGPFHHFGLHADQVCNCGPLRKHCTLNKKNTGVIRAIFHKCRMYSYSRLGKNFLWDFFFLERPSKHGQREHVVGDASGNQLNLGQEAEHWDQLLPWSSGTVTFRAASEILKNTNSPKFL